MVMDLVDANGDDRGVLPANIETCWRMMRTEVRFPIKIFAANDARSRGTSVTQSSGEMFLALVSLGPRALQEVEKVAGQRQHRSRVSRVDAMILELRSSASIFFLLVTSSLTCPTASPSLSERASICTNAWPG